MKELKSVLQSKFFFICFYTVTCFAILSFSVITTPPQGAGQTTAKDFSITNETQLLEIIEVKEAEGGFLEITFRNSSGKRITALKLSIGKVNITDEFISREESFIPAGAKFTKTYLRQSDLEAQGIKVLAVIYDDGSHEGNIQHTRTITDDRYGKTIQLRRFISQLRKIQELPDEQVSSALDSLREKLSSTRDEDGKMLSVGMQTGLGSGRHMLLEEIDRLTLIVNRGYPIKDQIAEAAARLERLDKRMSVGRPQQPNLQ